MAKKTAKARKWAYWYVDSDRWEWRYAKSGKSEFRVGDSHWLVNVTWISPEVLIHRAKIENFPNFRPKPGYPPMPGTEPAKAKPVTRETSGYAIIGSSGLPCYVATHRGDRQLAHKANKPHIVPCTISWTPTTKAITKGRNK